MKNRTLFYVQNPDIDIVLSKETGKDVYRILKSYSSFRTFPYIRWSKLCAAVEDCDYISDEEWTTFIYKKFLASLKDDTASDWDTNNGIGYTWSQMAAKINLTDDTVVVATYKE